MDEPVLKEADDEDGPDGPELVVTEDLDGERLDKALARLADGLPGLSRARIAALLAEGRVLGEDGRPAPARGARAVAGTRWHLALPETVDAGIVPEAIPLAVAHEDEHLIVVDKPAGMVVHPAPGAASGTLVNALLAHCGASLAGIGAERRPGIVHRIDKDTSGLIVAAKTETALAGLAAQFAAHTIERVYRAVLWGVPDPADPRLAGLPAVTLAGRRVMVDAALARHPADRKRMAVRPGGRRAVTHLATVEPLGPGERPWASLVECRLETGRTHQIRVHASHIGHPLVGDPVYGHARRRAPRSAGEAGAAAEGFARQALHAARLGFVHPASGERLSFEAPPPADFDELLRRLRRNNEAMR
ncbi:MAG: RluA family pseudouridine synthase [Paracoccaceae bacterium]